MTNIELRFSGYANFKEVETQVAALQAQFATLNKEMQQSAFTGTTKTNGAQYAKQAAGLQVLHKAYGNAVASSGAFEVSQKAIHSDTQQYIKDLKAQKLGLFDIMKARNLSNRALREQVRLQKLSVMDAGTSVSGKRLVTTHMPAIADAGEVGRVANRLSILGAEASSAGIKMVNFGKNSTWSGKQLSMGFTAPLIAFAAISGKFAYDVDKNLTSIAKVYDTTANLMGTTAQNEAARQTELNQLRNDGLATATTVARNFGLTAKSTLDVQAQLAAAGQTGKDLQQNTIAVQRFATLGELDYQQAVTSSIALQSTYKLSSDELAQSIDYMNAVENATSLSMQDFATAIPIASGPIQQLGGDIKTLGTLMTAMKERGVSAAEGANAIKSGLTRLYNPSVTVQKKFEQLTGQTLPKLTKESHGQLIPMLQAVGESIKNLDPTQATKALSALFGTYQRAKLGSLVAGLADMKNGIGQTAKAAAIANNTNAQNAAIARGEMVQLTQSASGKFRIAMATLQIQLAKTGQQFLGFGSAVLNGVTKVINGFNHLPGIAKKILEFGIVLPAVIGPLLMIIGLVTQLGGQGLRGAGLFARGISRAAGGLTIMSKEAATSLKITEYLDKALQQEATAAGAAANELKIISEALIEATKAQQDFFAATEASNAALAGQSAAAATGAAAPRRVNPFVPMTGSHAAWEKNNQAPPMIIPTPGGTPTSGKGSRPWATKAARAEKALSGEKALQEEQQLLKTEQARANAIKGAKASSAALGASMILQILPLGQMVSKIGQFLMIMVFAVPVAKALRDGFKQIPGILAGIGKKIMGIGAAEVGVETRAAGIAAIMGGGVLIAVVAVAAAAFMIYKHIHKSNEAINKLHNDAKGLGDIFGFTASDTAKNVVPKGERANKQLEDQANKLNQAYPKLKGYILETKDAQEQYNRAAEQGFKAFNAGASVEQAKQVTTAALVAAGATAANAQQIVMKFGFDPANVRQQVDNIISIQNNAVRKANKMSFFDRHLNPLHSNEDSSAAGMASGKAGSGLVAALIQKGDVEGAKKQLQQIIIEFNKARNKITDGKARRQFTANYLATLTSGLGGTGDDFTKLIEKTMKTKKPMDAIMALGRKGNIDVQNILDLNTALMNTEQAQLAIKKTMNAVDLIAQDLQFKAVGGSALQNRIDNQGRKEKLVALDALRAGKSLTKEQLALLYKMASSNSDINDLIDYRNANGGIQIRQIEAETSALERQRAARRDNIMTVVGPSAGNANMPAFAKKEAEMYQSSMTSAWGTVGTMMSNQVDASFQGRLDGMQAAAQKATDGLAAAQKRAQDALDARQKKAQDALDKMWQKRKDLLKKEEDFRQKVFNAEMARIEREKAAKDLSTNYQAAVAAGNLDEAARLRNEGTATVDSNSLTDADAAAKAAYDKAQAALDKGEAAAKARLDKIQAAEKAALQASQARQSAALAASQAAAQKNAEKEIEINKAKIQSMLAADLAHVPTTEALAKKYIAGLEQKYNKMGVNLSAMSALYGNTLHDELRNNLVKSANELKTQVDWAGIAKSAVTKAVRGAWNMSLASFLGWVNAPSQAKAANKATASTSNQRGATVNHGGGFIGTNSGRAGYPMSASPYPSEQLVLAKRGEFLINDKAASRLGPAMLNEINRAHISGYSKSDVPRRNTGGYAGGWNRGLDTAGLGAAITKPYANVVKYLGDKQKAKDARSASSGGLTAGASLKLTGGGAGWLRPWVNKYAMTQGPHDLKYTGGVGGLDYGVPNGTKLYSPAAGSVSQSYDLKGSDGRVSNNGYYSYGRVVETSHANAQKVFMAHLSERAVKAGQSLSKGTYLGKSGNTGHSYGAHVHAQARSGGKYVDIRSLFASHGVGLRRGGELKYDNTLVNAHKGETMLTHGLTEHFKQGVENFGNAKPGNTYGDINVTVPEGTKNPEMFGRKVAMTIKKELDYERSRY